MKFLFVVEQNPQFLMRLKFFYFFLQISIFFDLRALNFFCNL